MPHRNAICKAYVTHSHNRNIKRGDLLIFYRTAFNGPAYYTAVITTIGIVEDKLDNFKSESDYIEKCKKRSIFTEESLKSIWQKYPSYKPFIMNFMYVYTFNVGSRLNRKKLLELNILTGEEGEMRGIKQISKAQFQLILKETKTNESLIVN